MKKLTQQEIIQKLLASEPQRKFASWELIKVNTPWGFLGSGNDRNARLLAENGMVFKKRDGKYTYYWHKKEKNVLTDITPEELDLLSINKHTAKYFLDELGVEEDDLLEPDKLD